MRRLLLALLLFVFLFTPTANSTSHLDSHIIILDPGHGGSDKGSTACQGLTEADANLEIALLIRDKLEANGADAKMTRTGDATLSNKEAFLSISGSTGIKHSICEHLECFISLEEIFYRGSN